MSRKSSTAVISLMRAALTAQTVEGDSSCSLDSDTPALSVSTTFAASRLPLTRCLVFKFKIDCQQCTQQKFAGVTEKLKATYAEKNYKEKSLIFRLCSPCFNYICSETKTIFEKLNIGEESPIRKSNLHRQLLSRLTSFSPSAGHMREFTFPRRESQLNQRDDGTSNRSEERRVGKEC